MSGEMRMEADRVRGIAGEIGSAADKYAAAKAKLDAELTATDRSWGDDDAGQDFAKQHVPATGTSEQNDAELESALRKLSTAVHQAADQADARDHANASDLRTQA